MDGILNINKPSGPTSHDIVGMVRRAAHQKRVGHAGTLDPAASGVLVVCLGNATRVVEYLMDSRKTYCATAVLGIETDSEDATGSITADRDCSHITRLDVESVLPQFTGIIQQIPPMVSALHHNGQRLYDLARAGQVVERAPRTVEIYSLKMTDFKPGVHPEITIEVECSKGTYIRTLCADIGNAVDCGGHMASLVRTAVGQFTLSNAVTPDELKECADGDRWSDILYPIDAVLSEMPFVTVTAEDVGRVANGVKLPSTNLVQADLSNIPLNSPLRIKDHDGRLLAIGSLSVEDSVTVLRPEKVFVAQEQTGSN